MVDEVDDWSDDAAQNCTDATQDGQGVQNLSPYRLLGEVLGRAEDLGAVSWLLAFKLEVLVNRVREALALVRGSLMGGALVSGGGLGSLSGGGALCCYGNGGAAETTARAVAPAIAALRIRTPKSLKSRTCKASTLGNQSVIECAGNIQKHALAVFVSARAGAPSESSKTLVLLRVKDRNFIH